MEATNPVEPTTTEDKKPQTLREILDDLAFKASVCENYSRYCFICDGKLSGSDTFDGRKAFGHKPDCSFTKLFKIIPNDPEVTSEMIAAATAHRVCIAQEHDPLNGKCHGACVVCGDPWPCATAKRFTFGDDRG